MTRKRKKVTGIFLTIFMCLCALLPVAVKATDEEEAQLELLSGDVVGTVYNPGGNTVTDVSGVTRTALLRWLGDHVNDNYYLGTPYVGMDNRNPNGDPNYDFQGGVVVGQPGMNCTGFVWHALTAAATMYGDGITTPVPGLKGWVSYLRDNHVEYKTYIGSNVTDLVYTAVYEDKYIEPGDLIWTWDAVTTPVSALVNGLANTVSGYHHIGIYIGTYFDKQYQNGPNWQVKDPYGNAPLWNRWWHSSDKGLGDTGLSGNQTSMVMPKRACYALTVVKLGDAIKKGGVEIYKKSSRPEITGQNPAYSLAGAKYGLYPEGEEEQAAAVLVTNENGYAKVEDLPAGTYHLKEIENPRGYQIDHSAHRIEVIPEKTTKTNLPEEPQVMQIELGKVDADTEKAQPQGAASLENAKYVVVDKDGKEVDVLVTDQNGRATSKELPIGDYTVKETEASNGYVVDTESYEAEGEYPEDNETKTFVYRIKSEERIIRGDVEIVKYIVRPDETKGEMKGLAGVEFTFTSKTTGKVVKKITTDEEGFATTAEKDRPGGSLVYDTYIVTETKYPPNVTPVEPFEVSIREDQVTLQGIYKENECIVSPVAVVKKDKMTGRIIPAKGAQFRILDENKEPMVLTAADSGQEYATFVTDEKGQFLLPERLEYGIYYLEELQAPEGYLRGELLKFQVSGQADWGNPLIIEFPDDVARGRIRIRKTDADTGKPLEGTVFTVTAAEEIVTPDGTVRMEKGETAQRLVTDADGEAVSEALFLGKYEVREVQALPGYVRDPKVYEIELKYQDQDTPVTEEVLELSNEPSKLCVVKRARGKAQTLKGVTFSVWREDMSDEEEKQSMQTDENGELHLGYLKPGVYCIQETKALPGFLTDDTVYRFTVGEDGTVMGSTIGIGKNGKAEIENDYTKVRISKQDAVTGQELPGAKLLLIVRDTGEVCRKWTSGEEPYFIEGLEPGDYILRETEAPQGYEIAQEIAFTVRESGEVLQIVMADDRIEPPQPPVKTGDDENAAGWIALSVISLAAGIYACKKGKDYRRRICGRRKQGKGK